MEDKISKRRHTRVVVSMSVNWGSKPDCPFTDRITSLSAGGCFLQTKQRSLADLTVYLKLWLPEEKILKGQVRYNLNEVGMGVEFVELADQDKLIVGALVDHYLKVYGTDLPPIQSSNT